MRSRASESPPQSIRVCMRNLYLVGMSPPPNKVPHVDPYPSGSLGTLLAPLDPRHGVFPNLVTAPLLSTLYHLHSDSVLFQQFFLQTMALMEDNSPRRLNVLKKPVGTTFEMDDRALDLLTHIDPEKDLLLIFGYWSISALVMYLLQGKTDFTPKEVNSFSKKFLRTAIQIARPHNLLPHKLPARRAPLPGSYFRLCSNPDPDGTGAVSVLQQTVAKWVQDQAKIANIVATLRSLVPLPHNEAYQMYPFGKVQNCFMLAVDPSRHQGVTPPPEVFWRFMGKRIMERLLVPTSPTP
jgi:hypothetical protein